MKNLKTALLCAVAAAVLSSPANAESAFKPYIGAEYQLWNIKYDNISRIKAGNSIINPGIKVGDYFANSLNSGAAYVGARINNRWGVELGYSPTAKASRSKTFDTVDITFNNTTVTDTYNNAKTYTTIKAKAVTLDLLSYWPIDESGKFEWIGAVGAASTRVEAAWNIEADGVDNISTAMTEKQTRLRVGAGAQYKLAENWNLRGMLRWQDGININDGPSIKNAYTFSLGVNYAF